MNTAKGSRNVTTMTLLKVEKNKPLSRKTVFQSKITRVSRTYLNNKVVESVKPFFA